MSPRKHTLRPFALQAKWFRSHAWLVALIGLVLEAAVTIPLALFDLTAPEVSAALAILIAAGVAFVVGPWWGALVGRCRAGGSSSPSSSIYEPRAILALPVWLALAVLVGLSSDRLRRAEREHRRDASQLEAVRDDPVQGIVGLDLAGNIVSWDRGAERIYGYGADEARG